MAEAADPHRAFLDASPPPRAGADWRNFVETIGALRSGALGWPAEFECARLWYEPHLERIHEDAVARRADLMQLEQIAGGYPSRQRFLTELTLDPPDATSDEAGAPLLDEDYLILSTIHSAKGREWKFVFVLNVVDGCMPSDLSTGSPAEIEEERRLLYVAMTRAKDELHLVTPQRFFTHGQKRRGRPPRLCVAHAVYPKFNTFAIYEKGLADDRAGGRVGVDRIQSVRLRDVGARMRNIWR